MLSTVPLLQANFQHAIVSIRCQPWPSPWLRLDTTLEWQQRHARHPAGTIIAAAR